MGLEDPQSKRGRNPQLIPWAFAIVSISVLSACFIASCLVTYHQLLRFKRRMEMVKLPDSRRDLTCIREEPELGDTGDWTCCPVSWKAFRYNCYFPLNDNQTWDESEQNCSGMGAHLATINTEAEQNFVTQFLDRRFSYFLGLRKMEGQWHWVDQMPFNPHMAFWHKNEPSNFLEEDCVILANDQDKWAWNDFPCNSDASRICKLPGATFSWKPRK